MKKHILIVILIFNVSYLAAQTIVSTDVENKKVILEEYTGIHCGYCPQGHVIGKAIMENNPGNAFVISIHTGGFAVPNAGEPDFRTTWGPSLRTQADITGFPAATVNRTVFQGWGQDGGTGMSRNYWEGAADIILEEVSYVNLAMSAEIDYNTRELTVLAEVYYTGNSPEATNYLNVVLLQDNTIAYQNGGGTNYNHMDRLVYMLTDTWGEEITTTTTGSFVSKNYTYTIPADYNDIEAVLSDLKLVGFITETTQTIASGNGCTPTYLNFPYNDLVIEQVTVPNNVCSNAVTPTIEILNKTANTLTELVFEYSVNGESTHTYTWTGSISTLETKTIVLDEITFSASSSYSLDVEVIFTDNDQSNNSGSVSFNPAPQGDNHLFLDLNTDNSGDQCTWDITDQEGNIVQSGGPYDNNVNIQIDFLIDPGCNTFNLYDSYGNGGGSVTLSDSEGNQLYYTIGDYGAGVAQLFNTYSTTAAPTATISPENGATGVALNTEIAITFDQAIRMPDASPISDPSSLVSLTDIDGNLVDFTATINSEKTIITVTPNNSLEGLTEYSVLISAGSIENNWDVALETDIESSFITEEASLIPNLNEADYIVYPNPVDKILSVKIPASTNVKTIAIYDAYGKQMQIISNGNVQRQFEINLAELPKGLYFISFSNGIMKKVIVK
ncbi:MAG: hypothetical protein C0599_02490 [Salinivirgaceae bacterium]|nr:MAG: hypothetical protein C0599_02490 [Salinivirgaceae bacterium]